jgi:hypothetical protein
MAVLMCAADPACLPACLPACSYAFQWWLLPRDDGGSGPGITNRPYALAASITAALLVLMLLLICLLAVPAIRWDAGATATPGM